MKTLLLMRHAKSSWKNPELSDHDRPLNKRGKADAPRMGEFLCEQELVPDIILTSTAKRARKTAQAVAEAIPRPVECEEVGELYFGSIEDWLQRIRRCDDGVQCVMLFGHNPGLEIFLEMLTGEQELLPTAAVAEIECSISHWKLLEADRSCHLAAVWRPKELPR